MTALEIQLKAASDKAMQHTRSMGHYYGRFLCLRADAKKLPKQHRDRVLCATHFWNWREACRWAAEASEREKALRRERDAIERELAKQGDIFAAPFTQEAAPVVIGAQLTMMQTVSDPKQLQLF